MDNLIIHKAIMRILALFLTFLISACSSVETQPQSQLADNQHNARYDELVNTVKAEPSPAAIAELRQAYVLTDRFKTNAANEKTLSQSLFKAMVGENWRVCLDNAEQALELNYISLNSHYGAMVCNLESGEAQQSQYHESVLNMLLEAIWSTGDGQSKSTAFFSTSTAEIEAFVEFHGLEIISRLFIQNDDKSYDVVTLKDPKNGEVFYWYFDSSSYSVKALK